MGTITNDRLTISHVQGEREPALKYQTIGQCLDDIVTRFGDRDALVFRHSEHPSTRLTYRELQQAVDSFAAGLIALDLHPGDRIGIWSQNNPQWVVAQLATAKAGLILVNINPAYRLNELEYVLNKVSCKALITSDRFKSSDYLGMLNTLSPELSLCPPGHLESEKLPHLKTVIHIGAKNIPGMFRFDEVTAMANDGLLEKLALLKNTLKPEDAINIQFTSGTTGFPKGATLTHLNILNNGFFTAERQGLTEHDRMCIPVPLYHCFGMVMANLGCITHGAAMIYPGEAFDPLAVLEAVSEEKCTALYGVPTMFIAEMDHPHFKNFDLSTLRTGVMAGAPCPTEIMKRVIQEMHMKHVTIGYGMTETSPVSFQSDRDDTLEKRVGTVGRIHPHVECKIIDPEGNTVPVGECGEILTRGYSVMQGYWGDAELTAEVLDKDGWMHTGDLAVFDEAGYCHIAGRLKDMVIRGGENIYPREVEEFLHTHPDIQDVQCFGVPDERYGEVLCAWIRVKPGAADISQESLQAFCTGQIAHYKIPRHIRCVEDYPMTVTGKAQKYKMRELMMAELALTEIVTA